MDRAAIYTNGTYLQNNPTWHGEDSPWKAAQITRILRKNAVTPSSVCEVGCGAGEILRCLADTYGADVSLSGYEISPQAFEICRKNERQNLHFHLRDLLAEKTPAFDVVMAIDVFEHIEDCYGFLRRLREKGTYKVFHIPLDLSVQSVLRSSYLPRSRALIGHLHLFTKETALATLKDTGYEIIDHCYTGGSLELPHRSWKANLMKLPRRVLFALSPDFTARVLGGFSLLVLAR